MDYELHRGDCLDVMPTVAGPVDMILADLPYGTTACAWDSVIPFEPLWAQYKRLIKPRGAVVLFGSQPFTSALVMSQPGWFKYCYTWDKKLCVNFLNAHKQPLRRTEDICVFYQLQCTYNPMYEVRGQPRNKGGYNKPGGSDNYGTYGNVDSFNNIYFPTDLIEISNTQQVGKVHPTQKPVALLEYLIRTYTNEGETVLDNTMGSGSTGVACMNTKRRFIGIEKDEDDDGNPLGYFAIADRRIADAARQARGEFRHVTDTGNHDDLPLFAEARP